MTKTRSWLMAGFLVVCLPVISPAAPIITSTGVWTDNRPLNDPFGIVGYNLTLFAEISDPLGVPNNISSVSARNLATSQSRPLFFDAADQFVNAGPYISFSPFSPTQLGVWQFNVTNLQGQIALQNSHNLDKPARLEFPTNIRADLGATSTTSQVTFDPVLGADSYSLTVYRRVGSDLVGIQLLSSTTPSFSIPNTLLTPGDQFVLRVRAADRDFAEFGGPIENRSVNAVDVSIPRTPIPTATPPLSSFPAPDRLLFEAVPFVNGFSVLFSPESQAALTTPIAILGGPTASPFLNELKLNATIAADSIQGAATIWGFGSALARGTLLEIVQGVAVAGITLLPDGIFSPSLKNYLSMVDLASTASDPTLFLLDFNALIWGQGVAPQLRILGQDPPDPNYTSVVSIGIPTIGGLPTTGNAALDAVLRSLFDSTNRAGTFLEAVNVSVDRYGAAFGAGDPISATLQLEAVLQYLAMYVQAARQAQTDLLETRSLLTLLGHGSIELDLVKLRTVQDDLRTRGSFPGEVMSDLLTLGLTSDQVEEVYRAVLAFDPRGLPNSVGEGMAVVASALLPSQVAWPPAGILLGLGVVVLCAAHVVRGRRVLRAGYSSRDVPRVDLKEKT
jgi:hypothetical protein